jgi:hypothetical protein
MMRPANLALRFGLELAALAALVAWGLDVDAGAGVKVLLAILAPAGFIAIWGAWIAPKAARRLADPLRLVVELVLFGAAVAALFAAGSAALALIFAVAAIVNEILLGVWDQREY